MKSRGWVFWGLLWVAGDVLCALPPEHEAERLLLQAEQYIETGALDRAEDVLARAAALQTTLPLRYYFFRGQTLASSDAEKARELLSHYVVMGGGEAPYYRSALQMITRLEPQSEPAREPQTQALNNAPGLVADPVPLETLKQLYLTDDAQQALLQHINSLLSAHAYTGSRLVKEGEQQGQRYHLSVHDKRLHVRQSDFDSGQMKIRIERLEVMGIDPFVRFGCDSRDFACWLYHPTQSGERWLWIENNQQIARELSESVRRLIVLLQAN